MFTPTPTCCRRSLATSSAPRSVRPVVNEFAEIPAYDIPFEVSKVRWRHQQRKILSVIPERGRSELIQLELDRLAQEDKDYRECVERQHRISELNELIHKHAANLDAASRYRRERTELRRQQIAYRTKTACPVHYPKGEKTTGSPDRPSQTCPEGP
jgi:hypothetical protein